MQRQSKQGKGSDEELQQQYKDLQEKWDSIKQLKPRTLRRSLTDSRTIVKGLYLLDKSSRNLMSPLRLRRSASGGGWKVRNNDLAILEASKERLAEWDSIKQLKPRTLRRSLTESRTIAKNHHLPENSPRNLMSPLQRRRSVSGGWKVRNNDLAIVEASRERPATIESGKLKGRRLFDEEEGGGEVGSGGIEEIICVDNWDGLVQEISEVRSVSLHDSDDEKESIAESKGERLHPSLCSASASPTSSSSSCICGDCMEKDRMRVEEKKAAVVMVKANEEGKKRGVIGVKGLLARGLIVLVCAIGVISMKTFTVSNYRDGNKVILVPT